MKSCYYYLLLLCFILLSRSTGIAQAIPVANEELTKFQQTFAPLVGKTWKAQGVWVGGNVFEQIVEFSWGAEKTIVTVQTQGFIDKERTQIGERNHGVRYFDTREGRWTFMEFDIFGGLTAGSVQFEDGNIYYHYDYGGTALTDAWEKVDENTYNFTVGVREEATGNWEERYLETQFKADVSKDEIMMPTDMSLPYRQIPEYPEEYNACTVAARMIDGLGFRYYWATEGLRQEDLDYRTTEDSRTSSETIDHIFGLTNVVYNAVMEKPNIRGGEREELTYAEKRARTLELLAAASEKLKQSEPADMERFDIIFQRGDQSTEYPFWNNLNGPLADALWHVGQIVAFRRASGNPFNSKVSVLRGKMRE